ncbi:hypothetical protein [Roseococcus sp.]|uniref:hypothetical protein n=1 Tax=Roseococcus sp. TaxID=2109646 RepID=UPI003BA8E5A9
MRLVLILAVLLVSLPPAAEAQSRGIQIIRGPMARSGAALEAARRFLCPNGGVPQGRGRCTPGARYGGGGGTGSLGDDPEVRDWDRGIAAPSRAQAPCPPGTVASAARAQPNVTRCIAG